jgi:rhodanese-related sulfurtransferase
MSDLTAPAEISVTEAKRLLEHSPGKALLIDVREPWETQICQVAGARLIPMRQIPERLEELPRDQQLLVMCHHGARSLSVAQFLKSRGFTAVSNVTGGIASWADELDPKMARY